MKVIASRFAALGPLLLLVVSTVAWSAMVLPFFPTRQGTLGHDMGYFLPLLIEGFAGLKQSGFLSPPAFSPAFCAGMPLYGNPQSIPYSLTGLLLFVTDPIGALRASLVITHVIAWLGTYATARLVLRCDRAASALAAVLFAWSTVVFERALAGHWSFVAYGTTLVVFLGVGLAARGGSGRREVLLGGAVFALAFASWLEAGFAVAAVPLGTAAGGFVCLVALRGGSLTRGFIALAVGGALAFLLSAPKLLPMMAFLRAAPRDLYLLPAYDDVLGALRGIFTLVFLEPHHIEDPTLLIPVMYRDVERAWSVGPVGLLALGALGLAVARSRRTTWTGERLVATIGLIAVLALPLLLTVQNDALFAVVKKLPVLKSTWSFTRWYCIYAPFVALGSALLLADAVKDARLRAGLVTVLAGVVMLLHSAVDRSAYHKELFDPRPMLALHRALTDGQLLPDITHVTVPTKTSPVSFIMWNSAFAAGHTSVPCYEPLFGYDLEAFPGDVQEGPVDLVVDGRRNLLDPRCLLYPEENGCRPGDRFRADDPTAAAFARREEIPFEAPALSRLGPWLRALGFLVVALVIALTSGRLRLLRRESAPRPGGGARG